MKKLFNTLKCINCNKKYHILNNLKYSNILNNSKICFNCIKHVIDMEIFIKYSMFNMKINRFILQQKIIDKKYNNETILFDIEI